MTTAFIAKLPLIISRLSSYRRERLSELLLSLKKKKNVSGILLGGSVSYKENLTKSDIDLFCLVKGSIDLERNLNAYLSTVNDIDEIIFQGSFPWTGNLHTIYFKLDIDFSIDLCLINLEDAHTFFWEPEGIILFDKAQIIGDCRTKQMSQPDFTRQPFLKSNPFCLSIVTLKKIEKNISRNHLWNALEQLSSLRRYIMQIIRLKEVKHDYFLGRVDRDIEDVISMEINDALSKTVAIYDAKDIARKTILLMDLFVMLQKHLHDGNESQFQYWIHKQVNHEMVKLQKFL
jgi:hypothetical protein